MSKLEYTCHKCNKIYKNNKCFLNHEKKCNINDIRDIRDIKGIRDFIENIDKFQIINEDDDKNKEEFFDYLIKLITIMKLSPDKEKHYDFINDIDFILDCCDL